MPGAVSWAAQTVAIGIHKAIIRHSRKAILFFMITSIYASNSKCCLSHFISTFAQRQVQNGPNILIPIALVLICIALFTFPLAAIKKSAKKPLCVTCLFDLSEKSTSTHTRQSRC